jgi:hypothetical protein
VVSRRLLVIALLALVCAAGLASTTAMASTTIGVPGPALGPPSTISTISTISAGVAAAVEPGPPSLPSVDRVPGRHGGAAAHADAGVPCVQHASCAGGALLAGATMLLFLPATGLSRPTPALASPVVAVPTRLRSALLAGKLFRPPRAS